MPFQAFRIAMLSAVKTGPYERPHISEHQGYEWLIVERSGADGEFLAISQAGRAEGRNAKAAPADLTPGNTQVAMLVRDSRRGEAKAEFIFLRTQPAEIVPGGPFFPCEGYASLNGEMGSLQLKAMGRHFHTRGRVQGVPIFQDVPHPADGAKGGLNWHFAAQQRPWDGETG